MKLGPAPAYPAGWPNGASASTETEHDAFIAAATAALEAHDHEALDKLCSLPPESPPAAPRDDDWIREPPPEDEPTGTAEEAEDAGWRPRDLGAVLAGLVAGTTTRPVPSVGHRSDGVALFYRGRINAISGESGGGKSWAVLFVCAQQIEASSHVLMIDFEDDETGTTGRLLDLLGDAAAIGERFHYLAPDRPFGFSAGLELRESLITWKPSLVVIDSTGEAMAVQGAKQNNDDEVANWFRLLPRAIAPHGPCVLLTDHVTKDTENRGLHAIGSQRKRAAVTGAAYMLDTVREFGQGQAGTAKLTTAKDRNGTHVRGRIAAHFNLDATGERLDASLTAPRSTEGRPFRPTTLMERVSRVVEDVPQGAALSKSAIEAAVRGDDKAKRLALELLVAEGYISQTRSGQAHQHAHVKPYRASSDPKADQS